MSARYNFMQYNSINDESISIVTGTKSAFTPRRITQVYNYKHGIYYGKSVFRPCFT